MVSLSQQLSVRFGITHITDVGTVTNCHKKKCCGLFGGILGERGLTEKTLVTLLSYSNREMVK